MAIQHIASPVVTAYVRPAKVNVYILDVSGSMGWCCRQLAEDAVSRIKQLPLHDAVLIGLFSSPGWYRWIVARTLSCAEEYESIAAHIIREVYARNTTCFSEILADTPQALAPFLAGYQVVTLTFMSDGCVVVPDRTQEYAALDAAAATLKPLLTAGAIIAYGDYADRATLTRLASNLGIEFLATNTLSAVGETFTRHATSKTRARRTIQIDDPGRITFAMEADGAVTPLAPEDNTVTVSDTAHVYTLPQTDTVPSRDSPLNLLYGSALAMIHQNRPDEALELLSALGDVAITSALGNALTNAELATAEHMIQAAITDPSQRFTQGRTPGCLPRDDAFDLLDLLALLMQDDDCRFYPRHPAFAYKRIGRASVPAEGYPIFVPHNIGIPLHRVTGHASELNLSIGTSLAGHITLPETVAIHGQDVSRPETLPALFPTHIFRNYALIANALPVVTTLPVTVSAETYAMLHTHGLLPQNKPYDANRIEVLDLTRIPTCNKARGKTATDFHNLAALVVDAYALGTVLKTMRAKRKALDPDRVGDRPITYTAEQYAFLDACGIRRDGSFAPPVTRQDPTDVLDIRLFEVKVKPGKGAPLPYPFDETMLPTTQAAAVAWLQAEITTLERRKRQLDAEINNRRFTIALTGAWLRSFATDSVTIPFGGHAVTFSFRLAQKKI